MVVRTAEFFLSKTLMEVQRAVLTAAVILSGRTRPAGLRALTVVLTPGAPLVLVAP